SLNLMGASRWSAPPQFALRACVSRTRQHCILRGDPTLDALAAQMEWQFVFNGRRTNHARVAHFNQRRPLGVSHEVRGDLHGAKLIRRATICASKCHKQESSADYTDYAEK